MPNKTKSWIIIRNLSKGSLFPDGASKQKTYERDDQYEVVAHPSAPFPTRDACRNAISILNKAEKK